MQHKMILENWRVFLEQQRNSPADQEKQMDAVAADLEGEGSSPAGPRPADPKANKRLPIVNGINLLLPIQNNRRINAPYKQKRGKGIHGAIDQNVPIGTECVAVADGEVVEAIDQEEYDANCKQFIDIMKNQVFGVDKSNLKGALSLVLGAQRYANGRNYYFYGARMRKRMKNDEWRAKVSQKLNSLPTDWNGIRAFQDFLTKLGHRNFCAMFMRYLLIRRKVNKRMMAGKYIKILTDPDQRGRQWELSYMHMDSYNFKVGDKVTAGDVIGKAGASGIADDPAHLHFVLRKGRKGPRLDPAKFIPGLGNRQNPQKLA